MDRRFEGWSGRYGAFGCALVAGSAALRACGAQTSQDSSSPPSFAAARSAAAIAGLMLLLVGCGEGPSSPSTEAEIAYSALKGDAEDSYGIFLVDGDGKGHSELKVTGLPKASEFTTAYYSPQWSPDGERLAFIRDVAGASEDDTVSWVFVVGRDGKAARRLARADSAAWLPDSAALVVQRDGNTFTVTLEGETRLLAKGWGVHFSEPPALAADGATVAYVRHSQERAPTVYMAGIGGGGERKVASIPAQGDSLGALAWSSDDQALLVVWPDRRYQEDYDEKFATLFEYDLSGTSKIVATAVDVDSGIDVSNDGRVAFLGKTGLEVVDLKTRTRRTVVRSAYPDAFAYPQWSPNGSTIAYVAAEGADLVPSALETVQPDGSGKRRISRPDELVESFSWRPNAAGD